MSDRSTLDVILPVFNGRPHLDQCLERLAQTLDRDSHLWMVDDASTDPAVLPLLARWADSLGKDRYTLIRQPENKGFVATVNEAVARSRRDVILLNTDTLTTDGWLERFREAANQDRRIGTITPWSNNAEICSFPVFCSACPVPESPDRLAAAAARLDGPMQDLPTGVGFCMYIRRQAWIEVGGFDAATFGRGYGEENDFCQRAIAAGWRNVLCHRAYVGHVGGASFAALGYRPGGEAMRRLLALHPTYDAQVASFIAADPLAPYRQRLLMQLRYDGWPAEAIEALYPRPLDTA